MLDYNLHWISTKNWSTCHCASHFKWSNSIIAVSPSLSTWNSETLHVLWFISIRRIQPRLVSFVVENLFFIWWQKKTTKTFSALLKFQGKSWKAIQPTPGSAYVLHNLWLRDVSLGKLTHILRMNVLSSFFHIVENLSWVSYLSFFYFLCILYKIFCNDKSVPDITHCSACIRDPFLYTIRGSNAPIT